MIKMSDVIAEIEFLPPFSKVAQKAITLLKKEEYNMKEMAELIKYDPSLTANILKVVNSAAYAKSREVSDLQTALSLLGARQMTRIITMSAAKGYFSKHMEGYESNQGEIWEHSLTVAIISQELIHYEPSVDGDVLFTAALLHDIGKIILSQYIQEDWEKIQHLMQEEDLDFIAAEKQVIGFTHPMVGSAILRKWNFSKTITEVAKYHKSFSRVENPYVHLTALADYISMVMGKVSQRDAMMYAGYEKLLKKYNIKTTELDEIVSICTDRVNELLESFAS